MSSSYEPLFFVAVAVFVCRIHWQIVDRVKSYGFGCYIKDACVSAFLYADDISTLSVLSAAAHLYMWRWTLVAGSDY